MSSSRIMMIYLHGVLLYDEYILLVLLLSVHYYSSIDI